MLFYYKGAQIELPFLPQKSGLQFVKDSPCCLYFNHRDLEFQINKLAFVVVCRKPNQNRPVGKYISPSPNQAGLDQFVKSCLTDI